MAFRPWARARLHDLHQRASYGLVVLTAFVLALPDILDMLAGIDLTPLLPEWLPGPKFAAGLALARVVLSLTVRHLPPAAHLAEEHA